MENSTYTQITKLGDLITQPLIKVEEQQKQLCEVYLKDLERIKESIEKPTGGWIVWNPKD